MQPGQKTKIELLSPAKDLESGLAALSHGADAVYIGAPKFGAREAAGNPIADIEKLAAYAHRYFAKVYVVLNTILYENELEEARRVAVQSYEAGADALIVQDMAFLEMGLPPIPLFASTQTDNRSLEKVKFLQDVGFRRVILARELSLPEIGHIHQNTQIDLESFVHGALCVSYSGCCYMSQAITGRSANRGACSQMCRLPYDLLDENGKVLQRNKHLLSLQDLNLSHRLADLMQAGITSFKIEGRLKNIAYVKNITAHYRKALDAVLTKSDSYTKASSGNVSTNFTPAPEQSFSRGFTSYFINNDKLLMASFATPKSTGEPLGKIKQTSHDYFILDSNKQLNNADGLCFIDERGELQGVNVNRVEGTKVFPNSMERLKAGLLLYRNHNHAFTKLLAGDSATRQIKVAVHFTANRQTIQINVTDEDGVTVTFETPQCGEEARNAETAAKSIITQLSKTGNTLFNFEVKEVDSPIPYFYPLATLNNWRRELVEILENARLNAHKRPEAAITPNETPFPQQELDYGANVANSLAERFYKRHGVTRTEKAFELTGNTTGVNLMITRYCLRNELGICPKQKKGIKATPLYLVNQGKKYKLVFNCAKCQMQIKLSE